MTVTNYLVKINDMPPITFGEFKSASYYWVAQTYKTPHCIGGIQIKQYNSNGDCVRDGWLLHVEKDGIVYLGSELDHNSG